MTDTLADLAAPYRKGEGAAFARRVKPDAEDVLLNDICEMLSNIVSVPSVLSDHARMIIARVRDTTR